VKRGVVAAGDPQSAEAGAALLRAGGNAIDAAVATAFAAFVCELPLCSPLGGGAMLVELANGDAFAVDMFARAPGLGGRKPAKMDFHHVEVGFGATTQIFHVGRASVAVPLVLPGLLEVHRRWGSRPLEEVVAPAVALGRAGFTLGPGVAFVFTLLQPIAKLTPQCDLLYANESGVLGVQGDRLTNRDLATVLETLGRRPDSLRDLFAALAVEFGPDRGGLVTERDVEEARIGSLAPLHAKVRDWDVATMPAPSTGGRLVARGLELHEGDGQKLPFGSKEHFLAIGRVQERLIEERKGSQLGSTTHLSVIDEDGMAVAFTLTNGEGCGHVLSGTGMIANNLLGEEDIHPNGFHKDPPGAPLTTMMAPTILRRAKRRIALGSGGSNRLRNAILQVLIGLVEHGVEVETAVRLSRLHLEPRAEGGFKAAFEDVGLAPGVADAIRAAYPNAPAAFPEPNLFFGGVHAAIANGDGTFSGAGDARRGGAVAIV
jgi:gamma-glutamyltranspeptidase/glutathione hydrolase